MAKHKRRGKQKTKDAKRPQPRASTAPIRPTWTLALMALVCVGIAGFFWLKSLSGPQNVMEREEPPSGSPAEGAQQAVKKPVGGGRSSSQPGAEMSKTPAAGLVSAGQKQYTEEDLEQETMAVLNRLVEDFPDSADPLGLMGDVYVELGKTAEAMKCWEKCAELQPQRASSYVRMADTVVERGEFERAVAIAHRALRIDPVMPGIHSQLGRALRGLAKPAESLAAFEKAVKISPKSAENHHLLGQAYQQLQRYEQAKQSYLTALQINPDYTEACYGIASASARLGQRDEAAKYRKTFQEMKTRDWQTLPDERDFVLHQGLLVKSRHRTSKIRTNAGILYYERGRRQTAEKHWQRAAELDPANMGCREELMTLYQQDGRNQEALGVCAQLRQLAPENPQYHMCAGTLLTHMNRIEDALLAVKQAIELEPNNVTFRRIYGQIQERR